MKKERNQFIYFKAIFNFIALSGLFICLSATLIYVLAKKSGELNSFSSVVFEQKLSNAIYGPILNSYYQAYKLEMIKQYQPKITILGSSRSGTFRNHYFSENMVNATQAVRDLDQLNVFLDSVLVVHQPELIIICLDFWWFNDKVGAIISDYKTGEEQKVNMTKMSSLFFNIINGKISLKTIYDIFKGKTHNACVSMQNIGFRALVNCSGTYSDGSILYGESALLGRKYDTNFQKTFEFIQAGTANYEHNEKVSLDAIKKLDAAISRLKEKNIKFIMMLTPVAPSVYNKMVESKKYGYIEKLRNLLSKYDNFYDFHDPKSINTTDCEFVDGYHGGEITSLKILKSIYENNFSFEIRKYIKYYLVINDINKNMGRILINNPNLLLHEKDFLDLGCKRH